MIRNRRARIVATLGPASRDPAMVEALARASVDVFRLNFSHGTHEDHAAALAAVRAAELATGRPLAALADLQGPKLRLGKFVNGKIAVAPYMRKRGLLVAPKHQAATPGYAFFPPGRRQETMPAPLG